MAGRVTLATIAEAVGVSRMTVSNAFSRPDQLSPELRTRILDVAADLGYCGPDPVARATATGRTGTVGVLFSDTLSYAFTDEVATGFLSGVASVLEPAGLALTVLSTPRGDTEAGAVTTAMVDSLLVYSVDGDSPGLAAARRRGLPLVFADQTPEPGVPSVVVDDYSGALAAARHVRSLGHRKVALVAGALDGPYGLVPSDSGAIHHVSRQRMAGWREGLGPRAAKQAVVVNLPVNGVDQGRWAAELILEQGPPPTAFVCLTDAMAVGVLEVLGERKVRVPARVSVVGFDDSTIASHTRPPLTTVRQPVREKGLAAAHLLLDRMGIDHPRPEGLPATDRDGVIRLGTELVVRSSTAAPAP